MKIAVNLLPFRKRIAGAGKYASRIIYELSKLDTVNQYYLYISDEGKDNFKNLGDNFHYITCKFNPDFVPARIWWEQFIFPLKLKSLNPDIIFTPSVAVPFFYKGTFFTTIHDLAYKKNKKKYPLARKYYLYLITWIAILKSKVIFTVSNYSKKEIQGEFNLGKRKLLVTYNGVDENFFKESSSELLAGIKSKYNLPENFILYVGAIEPGKNLDKLLFAFSDILKSFNLDLHLVLTSGIGWQQRDILQLISDLGISHRTILLPYIPEEDLPNLYKSSKMLAYLSSYEGFGIPVLEAMAAGIPVITSKSEAIMEFSSNSVLAVDVNNVSEISGGICKIMNDKNFIDLKIIEGKKEAEKFTWVKSARIIYTEINSHKKNK